MGGMDNSLFGMSHKRCRYGEREHVNIENTPMDHNQMKSGPAADPRIPGPKGQSHSNRTSRSSNVAMVIMNPQYRLDEPVSVW